MALNAKPFDASMLLRMRTFGPKPSVVAHVDVNQEKEAFLFALENIGDNLGPMFRNLTITVTSLTLTKASSGSIYNLNWNITFARTVGAPVHPLGNVYQCQIKSVQFDLPNQTFNSGIGVGSSTDPPHQLSFWLFAKKKTITFADDNAIAGVNGPGFPGPLASSDAQVWEPHSTSSSRVQAVIGAGVPAASGGYDPICRLAHVGYKWIGYDSSATVVKHVPYLVIEGFDAAATGNVVDIYQQGVSNENTEIWSNNLKGYHPSRNLAGSLAKAWLKIKELENRIEYHH